MHFCSLTRVHRYKWILIRDALNIRIYYSRGCHLKILKGRFLIITLQTLANDKMYTILSSRDENASLFPRNDTIT